MFKNNFVVAIQMDRKSIRESGDQVFLPFDSEYGIYLKNLNSVDAVVDVSIDGCDVLNGNSIVVRANCATELLGYMNGNVVKNKFKFIEMSQKIADHRGIKPEDGIIRIEFKFKKRYPMFQPQPAWVIKPYWPVYREYVWYGDYTTYPAGTTYSVDTINTGGDISCTSSINETGTTFSVPVATNLSQEQDFGNSGITVPGSETQQNFTPTYVGALEDQSHVITLRLFGEKENTSVLQPTFTRTKVICVTCGTSCNTKLKFCGECGTCLKY